MNTEAKNQNPRSNTYLLAAWLLSLAAFCISLYSSEILKYQVCHLCWYQRICLYPLVVLLGMASFRNDTNIIPYALPLPVIGAFFGLYQYLQQMIPGFAPIEFCSTTAPCSAIHFKWLGFITFPLLGLITCVLLIISLTLAKRCRCD